MVPSHLKEGAYALGATRYEVITQVILPYTKSGLLGKDLVVAGPRPGRDDGRHHGHRQYEFTTQSGSTCLFNPGNTMASVIANEFQEAASTTYLSALIELGLVLFLVTVVINMLGKRIISRFTNE